MFEVFFEVFERAQIKAVEIKKIRVIVSKVVYVYNTSICCVLWHLFIIMVNN